MSKQECIEKIQNHLCSQFHLPADQVKDMLPSFVATLSSHMQRIEQALQSADLMVLGKAGHTMKGALLNLGLDECAKIALEIEVKGKAGDGQTDFAGLVASLRKKIDVIVAD